MVEKRALKSMREAIDEIKMPIEEMDGLLSVMESSSSTNLGATCGDTQLNTQIIRFQPIIFNKVDKILSGNIVSYKRHKWVIDNSCDNGVNTKTLSLTIQKLTHFERPLTLQIQGESNHISRLIKMFDDYSTPRATSISPF